MARGTEAKEKLINRIIETCKDIYIGCYDRKYYFELMENGEKVQIAISLTCPKNPVETVTPTLNGGFDFSGDNEVVTSAKFEPAEITQEEQDNIAELLARLGL